MKRSFGICSLALGISLLTACPAFAQDATPAGVADAGCTVAPRSSDELDALNNASPVATPAPPEAPLLKGDPVDAATLAALNDVLGQVQACAVAGDLSRLLALYTDSYVAGVALAPEPVPIVPGSAPEGTPSPGTPAAEAHTAPEIGAARMLPDGRVLAIISAGQTPDTSQYVVFQQTGETWQIADVGGLSGSELPEAVLTAIAASAGTESGEISVIYAEKTDWPDSALGCPKEGEFYAEVITPGYAAVVRIGDQPAEYHTDEAGNSVVLCG